MDLKCEHCGSNLWVGEWELCDGCQGKTYLTWLEYSRRKKDSEVARKVEEKCLNEMAKKPTLKRP